MPDMRQIALELLKYKVNDLLYRRPVEGGLVAVLQLHDYLKEQRKDLDSEQLANLDGLSATLLRFSDQVEITAAKPAAVEAPKPKQKASAFDAIFLTTDEESSDNTSLLDFEVTSIPSAYIAELNPEHLQERRSLRKLAERVWWHHLRDRFYLMAVMFRQEPERHTVRILYATLRNLNQYAQTENFRSDENLEHFKVLEPVPDYRDPLLSLNDTDSITELLLEITQTIMTFHDKRSIYRHLDIPSYEVMGYMQQMAIIIAADPYQGKLTMTQKAGSNAAQIRLAIQELSRENLRPDVLREQTSALQERLQEAVRFEKTQRRMFEKDVQSYNEAVGNFFTQLSSILPKSVGGDGDAAQPFANVLFAADPLLTTDHLPQHEHTMTIRLKSPYRFNLAGIHMGLVVAEQSINVYLDGQGRPIFDDTVIYHEQKLENNQTVIRRVSIFVQKDLNLLHIDISPLPRSLNRLIAEVMAVNYIILPSQRDWVSQTLRRITNIPSSASTQFARRSLRALLQQCLSSQQPQRYLQGIVVASLRLEQLSPDKEAMTEFLRLANLALTAEQRELTEIIAGVNMKDTALFDLTGQESISFQYENVALSVKRYEKQESHYGEHMVVINMGRVLGAFEEFMLQPLSQGVVLLARSQEQLATIYLPLALEDRHEVTETWG